METRLATYDYSRRPRQKCLFSILHLDYRAFEPIMLTHPDNTTVLTALLCTGLSNQITKLGGCDRVSYSFTSNARSLYEVDLSTFTSLPSLL